MLLAHQLVTSGLLARPKFYPSYPIIGNSVIIMARTSKDDLNKIWNFVLLTAYTNFNQLPTHFLLRYSKHTAITKYILQIPFEKYWLLIGQNWFTCWDRRDSTWPTKSSLEKLHGTATNLCLSEWWCSSSTLTKLQIWQDDMEHWKGRRTNSSSTRYMHISTLLFLKYQLLILILLILIYQSRVASALLFKHYYNPIN